MAVSFTSPTVYTFQHDTGAVDQGTYEAQLSANTWTATLSSDTGSQQIVTLNFNSNSGGTFVLHRDGQVDQTGTFAARDSAIPSTTGDPGDTTGDPNPTTGDPGGYNGNVPNSINGRTMLGTRTFTSTGPTGQTHTYTFGNGTFHDSDAPEESDGNFVYTPGNGTATLTLNYTRPASFNGDKHELNMTFPQKDQGKFTSVYTRDDGTQIIINGDFVFEPVP